MDLDLSDDQVALRDGIASMLAARVADRTRAAPASTAPCSTSSRARGRVLAPRRRFLVGRLRSRVRTARPVLRSRSARRVAAARRRPDRGRGHRCRRRSGSSTSTHSTCCSSTDRADRLQDSSIPRDVERRAFALAARSRVPRWRDVDAARREPRRRRPPVVDARGHHAHRRVPARPGRPAHRARGRVREGAGAVRPADRRVPGDQAHARRHAHAHRGRPGRRLQRGRGARRGPATPRRRAGWSTGPR